MSTGNQPPLLNMDQVKVDPRWALRIPGNLAMRRQMLPFTLENGQVLVACLNPQDDAGLQAVQRYTGGSVLANLAEADALQRAIERVFRFGGVSGTAKTVPPRVVIGESTETRDIDGTDIVALGEEIIQAAIVTGATDIHIEPAHSDVRIRLRVDGVLDEYRRIPLPVHTALISRFKVLAGMDIAERRAPQDGRFSIGGDSGERLDIRAATIPTKRGERLTLRLLAGNASELTLDRLGLGREDLQMFQANILRPNGLILLTGPTGCGKSTSLYAAIRHLLASRNLNVITIEDPVEYMIDGVSQVEVDSADKVSFHKALRSALRHDPDVLMIGEIRDELTAEIAVKAALTGHLVFSTLHTNSAASSVTRLCDMGIPPFLVGAVSRLYIAQRLVRRLCQRCRRKTCMTESQAEMFGPPDRTGHPVYKPVGCKYCNGSGFSGRTGLFELLSFDATISRLVAESDFASLAGEYAVMKYQQRRLIDDGLAKLEAGITSIEEVLSVVDLDPNSQRP